MFSIIQSQQGTQGVCSICYIFASIKMKCPLTKMHYLTLVFVALELKCHIFGIPIDSY